MKMFKTLLSISVFTLPASVLAAPPALTVHVPFAFVMAGQDFAPGDYRVVQSDNGIISVQGEGRAAMSISIPGSFALSSSQAALEFSPDAKRRLVGVQMDGSVIRIMPVFETERKVTIAQTH